MRLLTPYNYINGFEFQSMPVFQQFVKGEIIILSMSAEPGDRMEGLESLIQDNVSFIGNPLI
jgi:hypothetical protein